MKPDKRRHDAPEDRRNYEDRLNKQEPEGLTGKAKKRWHHVQFKARKAWVESERRREAEERQRELEIAQLEELAEETVLAESRKDLGWGGF